MLARATLRTVKRTLPNAIQRRIEASSLLGTLRRWYRDDRAYWEAFYGDGEDPWHVATDPRASWKRQRLIAMLSGRRYGRALEVGCAEGIFSEMLAASCDALLAVDISEVAIARARQRLRDRSVIRFERRTLPEEMPAGPFDLIVAADVLYYWTQEKLCYAIDQLPALLSDHGIFIAAHWRANIDAPLNGDRVHDLLAQRLRLAHVFSETHSLYRFDGFKRDTDEYP